ncbi:DUF4368 domain-containing protein [Brevibacillus aydinogluensis]|uniref:DUF4368 domain-containing protein n=1 Tax=Brevibacillus aydinogluensis TaxID=927786 RepID=UPI0035D81E52
MRLKKEVKKFMELKELTPNMLHRLVDKILVKADGSANIQYSSPPPPLSRQVYQ